MWFFVVFTLFTLIVIANTLTSQVF